MRDSEGVSTGFAQRYQHTAYGEYLRMVQTLGEPMLGHVHWESAAMPACSIRGTPEDGTDSGGANAATC